MSPLDGIETIAILMLENRSFDHVLGYLSLPPYNRPVDGLRADPDWLRAHSSSFAGKRYAPFRSTRRRYPDDPLHDRKSIAIQLGKRNGSEFNFSSRRFKDWNLNKWNLLLNWKRKKRIKNPAAPTKSTAS